MLVHTIYTLILFEFNKFTIPNKRLGHPHGPVPPNRAHLHFEIQDYHSLSISHNHKALFPSTGLVSNGYEWRFAISPPQESWSCLEIRNARTALALLRRDPLRLYSGSFLLALFNRKLFLHLNPLPLCQNTLYSPCPPSSSHPIQLVWNSKHPSLDGWATRAWKGTYRMMLRRRGRPLGLGFWVSSLRHPLRQPLLCFWGRKSPLSPMTTPALFGHSPLIQDISTHGI